MSRVVLLVEPDVDVLGSLAEALRQRGLSVLLANTLDSAEERARTTKPDCVVLPESFSTELSSAGVNKPFLSALPRFVTNDSALSAERSNGPVTKSSAQVVLPGVTVTALPSSVDPEVTELIDRVVTWAMGLTVTAPSSIASDLRGDLASLPLPDLVQLLSMHRRSGLLTLSTPRGVAELRLEEGDITAVSFRQHHGEKAFCRLMQETSGAFQFSPGSVGSGSGSRMLKGTANLILEAMKQRDESERVASELGIEVDGRHSAFIALGDSAPEGVSATALRLWRVLYAPKALNEVLDELTETDSEIFHALSDLVKKKFVVKVSSDTDPVPLCKPEQLPVLRAMAAKLVRRGFFGAGRIGVCGSPERLLMFSKSLDRVTAIVGPQHPVPGVPQPHDLGTLQFGDNVECVVVGVPTVDAFSPTWPLALGGVTVVVSLESRVDPLLKGLCHDLELSVLSAASLVEGFVESDPKRVAALLCAAISRDT